MLKKITILMLSVIFLSVFGFSQLNQTGSLKGVVTSPDGSPLPGVLVTLKSPKLVVRKMETITNENGRYRFVGLYPGLYEITYAMEGMSTVVRKGIKVEVGKTFAVDVALQLGKIEENIIVEGQSPTIDRQSTTKSTNLDSEYLSSIPALRTVNEFLNMTPGVNDNTAFGGSVRDNVYKLDGVNLNDPAVGTQGVFFGMDIMEEISVQTGGLSAQYSAKGANLNVVTKSGGNKLTGSAVVYYRHESLKSDNTKGTPLEGTAGGAKYELEPGVSIGGPIIKDKLWFFGNFSFNKRENFVNGYPLKADLSGPDKAVAVDNYRPYPYFKLTFQPAQSDKFFVSYNYSDIETDHRDPSKNVTEDVTRKQTTPTHVFSAQWTHTFGTSFITNLKASIVRSKFDLITKTTEIPKSDSLTNYSWGNGNFDDMYKRDRTQINFDGTLFVEDFGGSHEVVFGGELMFSETGRKVGYSAAFKDPSTGWGTYVWQYYDGDPYYADYDKPMDQKQKINIFSAFVNDTWNVSKNLTVNLGARLTHQEGIIPKQGLDGGSGYLAEHLLGQKYPYDVRVEKEFTALKWTDIAPRISAIYDIFSNGTTLLKASYSRYTGDMLSDYYGSMNPNQWLYYYGPFDPNTGITTGVYGISTINPSKAKYGNHEAKSPYSDEIVIGIERELTNDISVSARFLKKWYKRNIEDVDASALDIDKLMNDGELVWTNYEKVIVKDPHNGQDITFWNRKELKAADIYILNPPGADRKFTGVELTLNKRFSNNWSVNVSYVYSKNEGLIGTSFNRSTGSGGLYNNPNNHVNAEGKDENERTHVLKASGMYRLPFDINVGFFANLRSGFRTTRTVSAKALGLKLSQGDAAVNAESRGSYKMPTRFTLDIKVEKVFRIGKFNLRGFVDIFNVFNESTKIRTWRNSSTAGGSNPQLWEMTAIAAPRIFRLGAKFEF